MDNPSSETLDAAYRPFPPFSHWADLEVEAARWERYAGRVNQLAAQSPESLEVALDIIQKVAAIETGAIEGLYEAARGVTVSAARAGAAWLTVLDPTGETRQTVEAQLEGYGHVLDFATGERPVAAAWIRELHEVTCAGQTSYQVYVGGQAVTQPLPLGKYKTTPNHVRTRVGGWHSYAPVEATPGEMDRLVTELQSEAFASAHPVLQAAFVHYSFVAVHPFADGNGRVARALASIATYRAVRAPLLIFADQRNAYFDALEGADQDDPQAFVSFVDDAAIATVQLIAEGFQWALTKPKKDLLQSLERLYTTKGGFGHEEVDAAGAAIANALPALIDTIITSNYQSDRLTLARAPGGSRERPPKGYRSPGGPVSTITAKTAAPARADGSRSFWVDVPINCGRDDAVVIRSSQGPPLEIPIRMAMPSPSAAALMQVQLWLESRVDELVGAVIKQAAAQVGRG